MNWHLHQLTIARMLQPTNGLMTTDVACSTFPNKQWHDSFPQQESNWRRACHSQNNWWKFRNWSLRETIEHGTSSDPSVSIWATPSPITPNSTKSGNVLILGRVTSGEGGELILEEAERVLRSEFPEIAKGMKIRTPDEKQKRHGQAVAAASLPVIG